MRFPASPIAVALLAGPLLGANSGQDEIDTDATLHDCVTAEYYRKIEMGMSRQEAERILRRPPALRITETDRHSLVSSVSSHLIRETGTLWCSPKGRLWVVFDAKDRVTGKMLEGPPPPPLVLRLK